MGIRIKKRTIPIPQASLKGMIIRLEFLGIALLVIGLFFILVGVNPIEIYLTMIAVNIRLFPSTLNQFIPLLIVALGLAITFRARVDNIGAEGQYIMGIIGAAAIAFNPLFSSLPSLILLPLMFIAGFTLGAVWAIPVAIFRAKGGFQGVDVVVSFLLVFPALFLMEFLASGIWLERGEGAGGIAQSPQIPLSGQIPNLPFGTLNFPFPICRLEGCVIENISWELSSIHITLFLGLGLVLVIYYFLFRTVNGVPRTKIAYEISVAGKNRLAGQTAGMNFFKIVLITMILSGGLAALAGVGEIAASDAGGARVGVNSPGYGFIGIAIAHLGGLNPIGIIFSAFLFAAIFVGGNALKLAGLPGTTVLLFGGVIFYFVLVSEFFFRYTIKWR